MSLSFSFKSIRIIISRAALVTTLTAATLLGAGPAAEAQTIPSSSKAMLTFGPGAVIHGNKIVWSLPYGTNPTSLSPTFTLSDGATCNQVSGSTRNFTNPQVYTITAANGSAQPYVVTVVKMIQVNIDNSARSALLGPAGGAGATCNERLGTDGLTASGLLDASGGATSVGFTCDASNVDSWGEPGLTMLTSAAYNFVTNTPACLMINGLTPGKKYALYLASFYPNELGGKSLFSTTNTTTTTGVQIADNLIPNGNSYTWVRGVNYVRFDNLVPDANHRIIVTMASGTPNRRAYLSGFQLLEDSPPPADPYSEWLAGFDFSAFTNPDLSVNGDPDADGITNRVEFAYRLDPAVAENLANGLTRERWENLGGGRVIDLTDNHARFLLAPDDRTLVPGIDESAHGDDYGSRYRSFITAPVTGSYRFWIAGNHQAELWLADGSITKTIAGQTANLTNRFGKLQIATVRDSTNIHAFDQFPSQLSRPVQLQAGHKYYFEILHKQDAGGDDHVAVAWQKPGAARAIIPATAFNGDFTEAADLDNDNLPDSWESIHHLNPTDNGLSDPRDGQYGDLDADGLNNLEEYQLGTDPDNRDTDNDGLSDKDERDYYHTNPLDQDTQTAPYVTLPPHNYTRATGHWNRDSSGSLTALERRGAISYSFVVAQGAAGVYEIALHGGAAGMPRPTENLPLVFSINGNRIGTAILTSINGTSSTASTLSPWLIPGNYTLTVFHDNYRAALQLRIDSLLILKLAGIDANNNHRPDWLDQRLTIDNRLTRIPATSLTSPVCIEGNTDPGTNLQGATSPIPGLALKANNVPLIPAPSIDSSFYANVPLSEIAPVTLTTSFQSGAITESHTIAWLATDLRAQDILHIRQGDSLRLDATAVSNGNGNGNSKGGNSKGNNGNANGNNNSYIVTLDAIPLADAQNHTTHISGHPFPVTFNTPGDHTLLVTGGKVPAHTVTLHVHAAAFGPALSARAFYPREWTPSAIDSQLTTQADSRLSWVETTAAGSPRSFAVTTYEAGLRHVLARIPENASGAPSAIVARGSINGFYLAYISETDDAVILQTLPDGTSLMRGSVVAVGLPPDVSIRLSSYYQGTIFTNGSNTLWLTAADFDQNGIANIYFEWNGEGSPRMCTFVDLFTTIPPQN